jgi:hypothetical protein
VATPYRNGAPETLNFDSWADCVANAPLIRGAVLADPELMPQGGGPNAEELTNLDEWLTCEVDPAGNPS